MLTLPQAKSLVIDAQIRVQAARGAFKRDMCYQSFRP